MAVFIIGFFVGMGATIFAFWGEITGNGGRKA